MTFFNLETFFRIFKDGGFFMEIVSLTLFESHLRSISNCQVDISRFLPCLSFLKNLGCSFMQIVFNSTAYEHSTILINN